MEMKQLLLDIYYNSLYRSAFLAGKKPDSNKYGISKRKVKQILLPYHYSMKEYRGSQSKSSLISKLETG
jgi:hypothetical protein